MGNFPMFYEHDIPSSIGDIEVIAQHFGVVVTEQDIWQAAKQNDTPPHLGNLYLELLFSQLADCLRNKYPTIDVQFEVNALASYFNVNNQSLATLEELLLLVEQAA